MRNVLIGIMAHNHEKYIEECIESALKQTHPCKIYVTDDGSTDKTPSVILKYCSERGFSFHLHDDNTGNALRGFNEILQMAGWFEYVSILSGDDAYLPTAIEHELECAERWKADWVYGGLDIVDSEGRLNAQWKYEDCPVTVPQAISYMWRRRSLGTTMVAALFRGQFVVNKRLTKFPNTIFAMDTSTAIDWYAEWPVIRRCEHQVARYRQHSGGETETLAGERERMELDLVEKMKATFGYENIMGLT